MRNYLSIILCLSLFCLVACTDNTDEFGGGKGKRIVISAQSLGMVSRSADTDPESTLAWLDIYVMNEAKEIVYCERIDKSSSPVVGGGEFVLNKNRESFDVNKNYFIYIIANAKSPLKNDVTNWESLKKLTQTDKDLHLSGITGIQNLEVPQYFLMDGFAYAPTNGAETPQEMTASVINNGKNEDDLVLNGTLYRAAAKLMITIKQGENVEFKSQLENEVPLYSYYQLPISTLVVTPDEGKKYVCEKQTTGEWGIDSNNQSFNWNEEKGEPIITLVGYAYANDWKNDPKNESSLLLSIPMMWNKDGSSDGSKEASSPVNWYKVPLSKQNKFERNKCYVINITINAIGAEGKDTAIELKDIEYVTLDWKDVSVEIGSTQARYLTLNTDVVKIYDSNFDLNQLTFTSSSPIKSIKLKDTFNHDEQNEDTDKFSALKLTKESDGTTEAEYEEGDGVYAYYIDKFGQKIQLGTDPGFDIMIADEGYENYTKEQILALENNLYQKKGEDDKVLDSSLQHIHAEVPADQVRALNGNIHIYSPMNAVAGNAELNWNSHFNAVRYLEFEVMNEQGLTATFRVEQTPTTVINNIEGFFSYRSDFHIGDDEYVYHNPADWYTPSTYPNKIENTYGKNNPPTAKTPAHFLNPTIPMYSFSGFQAYHEDPVEEDGRFVKNKQNCSNGSYEFDEALYGNMPRNYYRTFDGNTAGSFHRGHFYYNDGSHFNAASMWKTNNTQSNASAYYQAVGRTFKKTVDGVTKYYRRHYTGNLFETFQSKVVREVYMDDDESRTMPILEEVWYCPTCTASKTTNPQGGMNYIKATDCVNPTAHKKSFYNGYYDTGKVKKIVKGMGAIFKIMASGEGEDWQDFTSLNPMILKPLTSKDASNWAINRTMVQGAILHNHRMYHVRVNSTSDKYTVAVPRMMDEYGKYTEDRERGFTMESEDNANVVSPSFMIASQLGETIIPQDEAHYVMPGIKTIYELARNQCREYVETYYIDTDNSGGYTPGDAVYHYDDWRLPTRAEIEYIVQHQESSRAMDKVLNSQYYFHASVYWGNYTDKTLLSDEIPNYDQAFKGWYMRCVRDAFKKPKPTYYNR